MIRTSYVLLSVFAASCILLLRCKEKTSSKRTEIRWKIVLASKNQIDFCQINSGLKTDDVLITYSNPYTVGGGFEILKANFINDSAIVTSLRKTENKIASDVESGDNVIGYIQDDFVNRTIRATLLISDNCYAWNILKTPLTVVRQVFFLKDMWLVEGYYKGTNRIFESIDKGHTWREITSIAKKYKSFHLMTPVKLSNSIICIASTSFNEKNNKLLLFDAKEGSIKEIAQINSLKDYIHIISKVASIYAILDGSEINLYSNVNNELQLKSKIQIPKADCEVTNLYIRSRFVNTNNRNSGKRRKKNFLD